MRPTPKKKKKKNTIYGKSFQCPWILYDFLEKEATQQRKKTGKDVKWTDVLKTIIIKHYDKKV